MIVAATPKANKHAANKDQNVMATERGMAIQRPLHVQSSVVAVNKMPPLDDGRGLRISLRFCAGSEGTGRIVRRVSPPASGKPPLDSNGVLNLESCSFAARRSSLTARSRYSVSSFIAGETLPEMTMPANCGGLRSAGCQCLEDWKWLLQAALGRTASPVECC
jgi:hypothetical protein